MNSREAARDGAMPDETRAIARLPGIDIAIVHTAAHDGRGESVTVVLQKTPMPAMTAFDPIQFWVQATQAAWAPWLALTGSLWALPRIMGRD